MLKEGLVVAENVRYEETLKDLSSWPCGNLGQNVPDRKTASAKALRWKQQ